MKPLSLNERRLVELVVANPGLARVDLAKRSGMTGASITRLVAGLLELGVFSEKTDHKGESGQPKKILSVNAQRFFAAGVTFSLSEMDVAIIDFSGAIRDSKTVNILGLSTEQIAEKTQEEIAAMRRTIQIDDDCFMGTGCSAPGNFGPAGTTIRAHQLFQDFDDPKKVAAFGARIDGAFFLENDGSAAALGEHVFGRQPDDGASLFLVHIGYGLGGGAVVDGKLFRGETGNACLPGVLFPYGAPRPTAQDLMSHLEASDANISDINEISHKFDDLQDVIQPWVTRAAEQLRHVVRVTTGFFDPSIIIIGGRLPMAINAALVAEINATPLEGPSRGLTAAHVRSSTLGPKAGAVGAACIPLFQSFFGGSYWDTGSNYLNGRRTEAAG
ncbi:ROK family transcriptional regulator [uncultured Tateyamaria sp.]|uniref:ROK family transcriptional regulator n=1 Tax=uncultured Tateyamaria sp. TaxID=455651 RepID=UPI00261A58BF|nr:ROK family transcriptional regulator [uncultured Tateyamaria sp.]